MTILEFDLFLECINGIEEYIKPKQTIRVKDINTIPSDERAYEVDYNL